MAFYWFGASYDEKRIARPSGSGAIFVDWEIRRGPCVMVRETDAAVAYQIIFLLNCREHCELVRATSPEMARKEVERKNDKAIVTAILPASRQLRWRAVGSKQRR